MLFLLLKRRYDKTENLKIIENETLLEFSHMLVEAKSKYSLNLKPFRKTYDILESIEGFSQIHLNYNMFPPIQIKTKPMIFILKRKNEKTLKTLENMGKKLNLKKRNETDEGVETLEKFEKNVEEIKNDKNDVVS